MALIELHDYSYRYPLGEDFALKNIDLAIEKGEFVALIGPNGSGKTTLCNVIRGFVPLFYKGNVFGQALLDQEDLRQASLGGLAVKVGYIFQNPFNQISYIKETVFEEIAYGLENLGVPPDEIIRRTEAMIEQLGIGYLKDKNPFELSGGQQQRVALASILIMEPEILVIDEPTSQLDPLGTEQVFDIINLVKKQGKTVILVEHKIDLLARFADHVIVMEDGRILRDGKAQDVLADKELLEHGTQIPSYARLAHRLLERGVKLARIPLTEEQAVEELSKIMRPASAGERGNA